MRTELAMTTPRNDLERMGVSGLRETMLGRENQACCGDCRFLEEEEGAVTHPCALGHGRKDLFSRFAMICPDFRLTRGIDDEMERRSGNERRRQARAVAVERRHDERRVRNTYCSDLTLPQASRPTGPRAVAPKAP
jgi:hypothetical protein